METNKKWLDPKFVAAYRASHQDIVFACAKCVDALDQAIKLDALTVNQDGLFECAVHGLDVGA